MKRTSPVTARAGGLVCRKRKLKNFYDPKAAGGCGVAPILSWQVFCRPVKNTSIRAKFEVISN
ncbi:hypothetical protein EG333_16985 [Pectobacterium versatile]|nr:hypothetical protein EG333_16985 [Pectobacterium versatile]